MAATRKTVTAALMRQTSIAVAPDWSLIIFFILYIPLRSSLGGPGLNLSKTCVAIRVIELVLMPRKDCLQEWTKIDLSTDSNNNLLTRWLEIYILSEDTDKVTEDSQFLDHSGF